MGAATYSGKGFKERAAVSGERPGGVSCRQQYNQALCQPPPPGPGHQVVALLDGRRCMIQVQGEVKMGSDFGAGNGWGCDVHGYPMLLQ